MRRGNLRFRGVFVSDWVSLVGKEEHEGPLGALFDEYDTTDRFGADTWEKAEGELARRVAQRVLDKARVAPDGVDAVFSGDLQNQCMASVHGLWEMGIPYLGLYGACSTMTEGMLLGASLLHGQGEVARVLAMTTSHYCAAERQFRQPLEYGGQRTPTAQWTATAGGAVLLGRAGSVAVTAARIGIPIGSGIKDASNMGAAMAPAAADTVLRFLREAGRAPADFDAVVTGDLGREGSLLFGELMAKGGMPVERHLDCGCMLYDPARQDAHAGASGCGCSASVLAAYFLPRLAEGALGRILFLSTGALMSPSAIQQGECIVGVAPLLVLEKAGGCKEGSV